ncbi:MAG TPA: amino acid ABC transporter permease [Galbitalea sp.]|jgi:polar amino acid transport system permease protein
MAKLDGVGQATGATPSPVDAAPTIKAVKLRHPWRNVIAVIIIVYLVAAIYDALQRKAFDWPVYLQYLFDQHISQAVLITIELTILAMVLAAILALLLAVMRLSNNPILKWIAWGYIWIFRGTPVYVQLTLWGLLSVIYPVVQIGLPFLHPFVSLNTNGVLNFYTLAVIGLGLNEAAYLAEIVRAGILSVDRGQEEASVALGMTWTRTMWRIVIPQSMRVIIPPTGNEFISMLKTTSLVTAVPFTGDLFAVAQAVAARTFDPVPLLLVASTWYLFVSSILSVGQYFLEKRFARGIGSARPDKPTPLLVAPDGLVDMPAAEDGR